MPDLKGLYAITDEHLTPSQTIIEQVKRTLQSGVRIVQYRNKHATDAEVLAECLALQELVRSHGGTFIIDDRYKLAIEIGADGVHIGKDDTPLEEVRKLFKGIIGVSCYGSLSKAKEAESRGADYVAFGSFFPSPTKPHSGIVKRDVIGKAKEQLCIPVCAIGGINAQNIAQIKACEPDMVALISAIYCNNAIEENIKTLYQEWSRL